MITLTNPKAINVVLGGTAMVDYDKFVLSSITHNPVAMIINAAIRITSTTDPNMQAISGSLSINTASAVLTIEVPQLDFYRQISLTGPQNNAVQTIIRDAQNDLENGLISVGVVDGTQAPGA